MMGYRYKGQGWACYQKLMRSGCAYQADDHALKRKLRPLSLSLYVGQAQAQAYDPQSVLDSLIRRQFEEQARRDTERQQQQARALFHARLSDAQVRQQLTSFCPTGATPCRQSPPTELVQEAIRRGLIRPARLPPGMDCVTIGDEDGAITECDAR
jgi:hypothetical protein